MADEELRKAFTELQAKKIETAQRVKVALTQIQSLKISIKRSELAEQEIGQLPDGTNTYQSMGRMFLLSPVSEVKAELRRERREAEEKVKGIEVNIGYWEKSLKENESSIRELISQKRDK